MAEAWSLSLHQVRVRLPRGVRPHSPKEGGTELRTQTVQVRIPLWLRRCDATGRHHSLKKSVLRVRSPPPVCPGTPNGRGAAFRTQLCVSSNLTRDTPDDPEGKEVADMPTIDMAATGRNIRDKRIKAGMTVTDVTDACGVSAAEASEV